MSQIPNHNSNMRNNETEEEFIDLQELLMGVLRFKWIVLLVAFIVAGLVTAWTLRQTKVYQAKCTLEYDPNPPRPLGGEVEDVAQPMYSFWLNQEFYETQNRIIQSRNVAERVVRKLGLHRDPEFIVIPESEIENGVTYTAEVLRSMIEVKAVKETRLVEILVQDTNPTRAGLIANEVAKSYIEKTIEDRQKSTEGALEWLIEREQSLSTELQEAELALHKFKEENKVPSLTLEDLQNNVSTQIQRYTEKITEARTQKVRLEAKIKQLREIQKGDLFDAHSSMVDNHPVVVSLRENYQAKKTELSSFQIRYGDAHPTVQSLLAELEKIAGSIRFEIKGLIDASESDLNEARFVERGLVKAYDEAKQQGLALNKKEMEYARLNRNRATKQKLHSVLLERKTETQLTNLLQITNIRMVDAAILPKSPIKPRVYQNIAIGVLGGLFLGIIISVIMLRLDRTLKSVEEVENLGPAVLGIFPLIGDLLSSNGKENKKKRKVGVSLDTPGELIVHSAPRSSAAECCRTIRTNLTFMSADKKLDAFVVTSAGPQEGKTTTTTNLAIAIAQSGKRVLIVDTDMRRPRLHKVFKASPAVGITSYLAGEKTFQECYQDTEVPGLKLMPCGPIPPNPAELLHTQKFQDFIQEARNHFDQIIFDSPPLGAVTDAAIITPQVNGVILVARAKQTTRDAFKGAVRQLADVNGNILGTIFNYVDLSDKGYGYRSSYYYYYRGDYYASEEETTSTGNGTAAA